MGINCTAISVLLLAGATCCSGESQVLSQEPKPAVAKNLGIGFGLRRDTNDLLPLLTNEADFIDVMVRPGVVAQLQEMKSLWGRTSCICRSLEQMQETVSLLRKAEVKCGYPHRDGLARFPAEPTHQLV